MTADEAREVHDLLVSMGAPGIVMEATSLEHTRLVRALKTVARTVGG